MEELFERVREEASRSAWSEGVSLARGGAVLGERSGGGEVVVRVRPSGGLVHPTVILYPDDAEWECDCGAPDDPCSHVAAAVIAVRQARRAGRDLPASAADAGGALRYRFTTTPEGLAFERTVLHGGEETPLRGTLSAVTSGRVEGPPVSPNQADVVVESALGPNLRGVVPRGVLRALLRPLEECPEVRLDGAPVRTSGEPVGMRAVVSDRGEGFLLRVEPWPPVDREVAPGIALCGDTLREIGPGRLDAREREQYLGRGRAFGADEVGALVSDVLPGLEERMPVVVETERLPTARREPPQLAIETSDDPEGLAVLATLEYGEPPVARVDAGRLTLLGGAVPVRDEASEERLATRLRARLGLVPGRRVVVAPGDAVDFVARLEAFGGRLRGDAHRRFFRAPAVTPEVAVDGDVLTVHFSTTGPDGARRAAQAEAVVGAWRRGDPFVALQGGGFAPLPANWLAQHGHLLADLLAARDARGRIAPAAAADLAALCVALEQPLPPSFEALRALLEEGGELPPAAVPEDCRAKLRSYQREGVRWLQFLGRAGLGALLADDMGLGKTLQALCAVQGRTLVVAPTSLLGNWSDEVARFRPALRVGVYHGAGRELEAGADLTLTTWALLRRDQQALQAQAWDTVVLDEAQTIKNPESQVAQAAFGLRARVRITLTGTPVENRLEELWSQLHFLNPGLLGGRSDFDERYARPIAAGDEAATERLRERIRPFVLRRRKRDVAPELPPRTELVLHCVLSEEQRAVYDAVRAATLDEVVRQLEAGRGVMAALEALLRLRQACCHPRLLPGDQPDVSAKLDLLVDRLETAAADGHKALVFSQWTGLLDQVEPRLRAAGLTFTRLDGSTRDRAGVVAGFQSEQGPPVFLVSLRAGGTGLNLTAADHVFLLDPWWNPAVEEQAADRAHRIGQERPVMVYRLVAEDTVEERILALQERKRALAEAALGGAAASGGIGREELLALLAP